MPNHVLNTINMFFSLFLEGSLNTNSQKHALSLDLSHSLTHTHTNTQRQTLKASKMRCISKMSTHHYPNFQVQEQISKSNYFSTPITSTVYDATSEHAMIKMWYIFNLWQRYDYESLGCFIVSIVQKILF